MVIPGAMLSEVLFDLLALPKSRKFLGSPIIVGDPLVLDETDRVMVMAPNGRFVRGSVTGSGRRLDRVELSSPRRRVRVHQPSWKAPSWPSMRFHENSQKKMCVYRESVCCSCCCLLFVWLGGFGLGWVGLGWVGLGWVCLLVGFACLLVWFGLGWVGLGWVCLFVGLVWFGLVWFVCLFVFVCVFLCFFCLFVCLFVCLFLFVCFYSSFRGLRKRS